MIECYIYCLGLIRHQYAKNFDNERQGRER